jgi:outer membrane protein
MNKHILISRIFNFRKQVALAIAVILLPHLATAQFGQPAAADTVTLTLDQAIHTAVKKNSVALKSENAIFQSDAALLQSYGAFFPNLTGSSSWNQTRGTLTSTLGAVATPSNVHNTYSLSISSSLNLFHGFNDISALRSALANKSSAEFVNVRAKQTVAFTTAQYYLTVLLDREILRIAKEAVAADRDALKLLQEQSRVGAKALADLYQEEAQLANDELTVITDDAQLKSDTNTLIKYAYLDLMKNYNFAEQPTDTLPLGHNYDNPDTLLVQAYKSRPDLRGVEQDLASTEYALTGSYSGFYPTLSASSSYSTSGYQSTPGTNETVSQQFNANKQLGFGLTLSIPIFDKFNTNLSVQAAKVAAKNKYYDLYDLQQQIIVDVKQAWTNYQAALKKLRLTATGLKSATLAYETVKKKYEIGSASFVDLSAAKSTYTAAEAARIEAIYNFSFQKIIFDYYLGRLSFDK